MNVPDLTTSLVHLMTDRARLSPSKLSAHADAVIPPYYDSLIAKLIAHGHDRAEAIARMRGALDGFIVEGIKTTIPLHKRIVVSPDFAAGKFDTHFLERSLAVGAK